MVPPDDRFDRDSDEHFSPSNAEQIAYEKQLVAACLARQPGALDELLARYSKNIKAGIAKAIGPERPSHGSADHEDFYQDFCLAIARSPHRVLGHFVPESGSLASWLFSVSNHIACKRMLSKATRWPDHTVHLGPRELDELPSDREEALPSPRFILSLLDAMDDEPRTIIQARYGMKPFERILGVAEIAEQFGWTIPTAYRRLRSAMNELRSLARCIQDE